MAQAKFTLASPAFKHQGNIPTMYTCDGNNSSPALRWVNAPAGTKSFALIVDDPDAPGGTFVHWVVFNIPNTVTEFSEGNSSGTLGMTSFKKPAYGGPCPPSGVHHYHFKLYALDATLSLNAGASKEEVMRAMKGHILGQAELIGLYERQNK